MPIPQYDVWKTLRKVGLAALAFGVPAVLSNFQAADQLSLSGAISIAALALIDWYNHS